MDRPAELGQLKSGDWGQLQDLVDRFERACHEAGPRADLINLADYLPPKGDPLRSVTLHELIKTDLEIRWRRGQTVPIERYVERFPELGTVRELPPALIFEEYCVRQRHGDKPELGVYRGRFPEQFEAIQRLAHEQPIQTLATPAHTSPTAVSPVAPGKSSKPSAPSLPAASSAAGLQAFGNYQKVKRIGSGSFGEVYRAIAPGGIEVALKIINRPVDHEEAQRELQSLEQVKLLRHPYLLQTQAFFLEEDRLYIVMELADDSLRGRLKECRAEGKRGIPVAELIRYFRESAEALDFLHSQHRMHRDIKPENILILQKHAKVADFGLARMMESQRMVTATSSGTPAYMAPEVWRGKVHKHSDQYSLAATYAELRLDRSLIPSRDMMEVMLFHIERQPDLDPLPKAEQEVLLKGLSKNPDERYPNCSDFVAALETAVAAELGRTHLGSSLGSGLPAAAASGTVTNLGTLRPGEVAATLGPGSQGTHPQAPWQTVGAPPARGGGWATKILVGLIVFLLVGAGGWYVFTGGDFSSITQSKLERQVGQLIKEKHFADAVEAVEKADLDASRKTNLLVKVTQAWLREADDLKNRGNREKAYAEYLSVYERFPDNAEVEQRCRDGLIQAIPALVNEWEGAERFADALDLLQRRPGDQLPDRERIREEIRDAWMKKAQGELDAREYGAAEKTAQDILQRFAGYAPAAQILAASHGEAVAADVKQALAQGNYPEALKVIRGRGRDLPEKMRIDKEAEIKTAWQAQAGRDLKDGQLDEALNAARAILKHFPGDKEAMQLRDQAGKKKTVQAVEKLRDAGNYSDAMKELRAGADLIKDQKETDRLKTTIRDQWFAQAEKLAKTNKAQALTVLEAFRAYPDFRNDPKADELYKTLRPSRTGDNKIVTAIDDGDRQLTGGDAKKNDAKQYEQAAKLYAEALQTQGINDNKELKVRAILGQARINARLNRPEQLKKDLDALGPEDKGSDNPTNAYRLALRILAARDDKNVPAKDKLDALVRLKKEDLFDFLGEWETATLNHVFDDVVGDLDLKSKPPEDALVLADQVLQYDSKHFPTMLLKADLLYRKNDLQNSGDLILAAEKVPASREPNAKMQLDALKALVTLKVAQNPNSSEDVKKGAGKLLRQVLMPGKPRLAELAKEYAAFAQKNPSYRGEAVSALKAVLDKLPEGDKKAVATIFQTMAADHCNDLIAKAVGHIDKKDLDAALKPLADAESLAPDAPAKEQIQSLKLFASALKHHEAKEMEQAADEIAAVRPDLYQGPLSRSHRAQAALILREAAEKTRVPADANRPLQKPFPPETAEKAYKWLVSARDLQAKAKEKVEPEVLRGLVLAASCAAKPDSAVVRQAIAELGADATADKLGADAVAFLLAQSKALAESDQRRDQEVALQSYATLLSLNSLKSKIRFADADFAIALHDQAIKPAIRLGDDLYKAKRDASLGKNLAQLYAAQGRLIAEAPQAKWTVVNPKQVMLESYDKAIDYDPRAEYFARRGLARTQMPNWLQNLAEIKKDAEDAKEKDPELPTAYGLLGFVYHMEAAQSADPKIKIEKYNLAKGLFQKGSDLCKAKGDPEGDRPILLANRSDASVKLAHLEPVKRKDHLRDARADAELATKLPHPNPVNAFRAWGNALEDSAWLGGETQYYSGAVSAFKRAVDEAQDLVKLRIALGRCRYKWVAYGGEDKKETLKQAAEAFQGAIDRKPDPADEAEAQYWLANVQRLQADYPNAEKAFQRVVEGLAKKLTGTARDWERLATRDWAFLALDKGDLAKARQLAEITRGFGPLYGAVAPHVLGRAFEQEGDAKQAKAAYESHKLLGYAEDLRLYIAWLNCLLENRQKLEPDLAEVAKNAEQAVDWAKRPEIYDPAVRAAAQATAALAQVAIANGTDSTKEEERLRTDAVEKFREAIRQVPPHHPGYWKWRYEAAKQLKALMRDAGAEKRKQLADEARRYLDEAIRKAPAAEKSVYDSLRRQL